MKSQFFLLYTIIAISASTNVIAQLSGQSQVLYDSAYAQDPGLVNFAIANGAEILATPDNNSFYVKWFPTATVPNTNPVVVTLHGSGGNAFMEFHSWFDQANLHGCGIIALQWNRYNPTPPFDYFPDDTLYSYIDSALTEVSYPSNSALLHGFSRGSARSYALIFNDIQSGNNYFCTTISNAGKADPGYPLYNAINSGAYGSNVFAGKRWNLFCGPPDPPEMGAPCDGMTSTKAWLEGQGATVDSYIQDPALGHNGLQLPSSFAYKDSILDKYLECYNSASIFTQEQENAMKIYPNPFSSHTTLWTAGEYQNAALTLYNLSGLKVKQLTDISGQTITIHRDNLPSGIYFLNLTENGEIVAVEKLVITD